jgi:hypothetical protein
MHVKALDGGGPLVPGEGPEDPRITLEATHTDAHGARGEAWQALIPPRHADLTPHVERRLLVALLLVNLLVHVELVFDTFGEPDAVRLALDALFWKANGGLVAELASYRPRISPFYLAAVRGLLELGVTPRALPGVLNDLGVAIHTLALAAFHLVARRVVGRRVALVASAWFACTPAFFVAGLYGMPHVIAVAALLGALVAVDRALETARAGPWLLAAALYLVAAGTKADTMLTTGGALAWVWARGRLGVGTASRVALVVGVPSLVVIALGAALVGDGGAASGPPPSDTSAFLADWSASFPFSLAMFFTERNTAVNLGTLGPVMLVGVVVSCFFAARDRVLRPLLVVATVAALPLCVFWCFREGNAARHLLAAVPLVLVVAASALERSVTSATRVAIVAAGVVLVGYFAQPARGSPLTPTSRLVRGAVRMQVKLDRDVQDARRALARPSDRLALLGSATVDALLYERLRDARLVRVGPSPGAPDTAPDRPPNELVVEGPDGRRAAVRRYYLLDEASARALARTLRAEGWSVASIEWPLDD